MSIGFSDKQAYNQNDIRKQYKSGTSDTKRGANIVRISNKAARATAFGLAIAAAIATPFALTGCDSNKNDTPSSSSSKTTNAETESDSNVISKTSKDDPYATGVHHATLTVDGYDPIQITLDADKAPITVSNFCKLVNDGYYNGLTFYRFQDGFCMQGGTKGNTASGNDSSLSKIKGEFASNGVDNSLADNFGYGTVAMARTSDMDSATSTFFITLCDNKTAAASLDGQYAAFGTIDADGMKVISQIVNDHKAAADSDTTGMGMIDDEGQQAKIVSVVIDD